MSESQSSLFLHPHEITHSIVALQLLHRRPLLEAEASERSTSQASAVERLSKGGYLAQHALLDQLPSLEAPVSARRSQTRAALNRAGAENRCSFGGGSLCQVDGEFLR